jgi:hypothetical protein
MSKNKENCTPHCARCQYPVYEYARCCPMCGTSVETAIQQPLTESVATTRLDFWLMHVRKFFRLENTASVES